ncbi:protein FAM204A-like isoform X2 [Clytia hemisphaerica]|uniref:Uncharacterized protein n=1 Tax=Clytia hemisphaerica TaxID=252671 RepID=A0A7M5XC82_9CNID
MLQLNYSDSESSGDTSSGDENSFGNTDKLKPKPGNNSLEGEENIDGESISGKPSVVNDQEPAENEVITKDVGVDTKHTVPSSFSKRFSKLKQRRMVIAATTNQTTVKRTKDKEIDQPTSSTTLDSKDRSRKRQFTKQRQDEARLANLNEYMPQAFGIFESGNMNKKSRIEENLDEALKAKDFDRAQEISDKMTREKFENQVQGALEAQKYAKVLHEKDEKRKRKQRKKLNWAFGHKERWETKGNM